MTAFSQANDASEGSLPDRRREDAKTAAKGGDTFLEVSSVWFELVPEAELARGLVMPLFPPFKSISDLHLPTPYGSSIEQLNESPKRPGKII